MIGDAVLLMSAVFFLAYSIYVEDVVMLLSSACALGFTMYIASKNYGVKNGC